MADLTRAGVTLSAEAQEAIASAPIDSVWLYAYELWFEWDDGAAEPFRFVNDVADLAATLEASATWNPGEEVIFTACPLQLARPTESPEASAPAIELARPDVAGLLKASLDPVRGEPSGRWILVERAYVTADLSRPALLPPVTFQLVSVDISGPRAKMVARFDDEANIAVPRKSFTRAEYPGLLR